MIWPLFRFWGRNLSKFVMCFLENLRTSKRHSEIIWLLITKQLVLRILLRLLRHERERFFLLNLKSFADFLSFFCIVTDYPVLLLAFSSFRLARLLYSIIGRKWYFVTKIVLTYCEKKLCQWSRKTFEIRGWRPRICKISRTIIQTVKGQNSFWVTECFFKLFLEVSQISKKEQL